MRKFLFLTLWTYSSCSSQSNGRDTLQGKINAERELKIALTDKSQHNIVNNKELLIKDSTVATNIAETILFDIYGKEHIVQEKPYEIYLIEHYWVLSGSLPINYVGGTFLIIIDAVDGRVIKITHGK